MTVFAIGASVCLLVIAVLPGLHRRRRVTSAIARGIFFISGIPLRTHLQAALPEMPNVVVANHASYLDGIVLCALLPPRYTFVIKREVTRAPFVHFLLRRIGARFVERHNVSRSARDARAILREASSGQSIAVFPEGTFVREPGLRRFRSGAFAAAVAGGLDVVPVVLSGTREILPAERYLPRPGAITMTVLPAIVCSGKGREEARRLSDLSRSAILRHVNEPDSQHAA